MKKYGRLFTYLWARNILNITQPRGSNDGNYNNRIIYNNRIMDT